MNDDFRGQQASPTIVSIGDCPDLRYITGEELEHIRTRLQRAEELLRNADRFIKAPDVVKVNGESRQDFALRVQEFMGGHHDYNQS